MAEEWDVQICCMGAGYVGGPTMAVIAKNCPKVCMSCRLLMFVRLSDHGHARIVYLSNHLEWLEAGLLIAVNSWLILSFILLPIALSTSTLGARLCS
jgi:hypothetical protein